MRPLLSLIALSGLALGVPRVGVTQDIEALGARYGTPLPEGYLRAKRETPGAFEFRRGWGERGVDRGIALARGEGGVDRPDPVGPPLALGPRSGPVLGTFLVPVLLGLFDNSGATAPFDVATLDEAYFGEGPGTITDYYDDVSGGRVALLGSLLDWVRAPRADTAYTIGESGIPGPPYPGLGGGGAWNFIWELLEEIEALGGLEWGAFDNDGPDGVPDSGDDDGFVDVLAVIHPSRGGECGGPGRGDRIWSHRWSLSAPIGAPFVTSHIGANGQPIRIDDYTVQPSIACSGGEVSEIGVFAHELGHAFGLPDLYDVDGGHSGAGAWDLMSSGSWGCGNNTPEMPCEMGAWTKSALGWVDVVRLDPGVDLGVVRFPPVETSDTVFRVDVQDGSGEYFLIENRQRIGFDAELVEEGLLVWHVDRDLVNARWTSNRVNASTPMGVWLRQADGLDDLGAGRGRGDDGDPFPGATGNTSFHAGSLPAAVGHGGSTSGLTMIDITPSGDDVTARLSTRFAEVRLQTEGTAGSGPFFTIDGTSVDGDSTSFLAAPFVEYEVEVPAGEALFPGARRPFSGWSDDATAARARTLVVPLADTALVAEFGGTQYSLGVSLDGGVPDVVPATLQSEPPSSDLWFSAGTDVTLTALPRTGFVFDAWTGALAGQANPASIVMDGPVDAGADFELVFAVSETSTVLPAATNLDLQLEVADGTAPVQWSRVDGALPLGVTMSTSGRITGASLDLGRFEVTVEAVDALGLPASGTIVLEMTSPSLSVDALSAPFLLRGTPLADAEINFLNRQGNRAGGYDIGDFRAWVLANPTLPLSADFGRVVRRTLRLERVGAGTSSDTSSRREGGR